MKRKGTDVSASNKKVKSIEKEANSDEHPVFFRPNKYYIHPANFGAGRLKIFRTQIVKYGGEVIHELPYSSNEDIYVIFEESILLEKIKLLLPLERFPKVVCLKCTWLSACIKAKSMVETEDFIIKINDSEHVKPSKKTDRRQNNSSTTEIPTLNLKCEEESSERGQNNSSTTDIPTLDLKCEEERSELIYNKTEWALALASGEQDYGENVRESKNIVTESQEETSEMLKNILPSSTKLNLQDKFVCAHASLTQKSEQNSQIINELQKLMTVYKNKNETWKAQAYQKAISAIKNHPREITTREEALNIRGVGERLADKIAEIVESGKLRKVAEVCDSEEAKTLETFMGVWGAGPTTAKAWYMQGLRTLDDVRNATTLTQHQIIGLRLYDDLNSRIPRDEVKEIEDQVKTGALSLKNGLIVQVCGSYRRGRPNCGDVDVLITHPDGYSHENIFRPLIKKLKDTGFITDALVTSESNGKQEKWLGVCKLPGEGRKHRRLDLIVVPYAEYAPALMYFTGSAHFNRSMRLLAIKMGMSLSEHGLRAGIVRQGREKLSNGQLLSTPTETSIFEHLKLEYREPHERDH